MSVSWWMVAAERKETASADGARPGGRGRWPARWRGADRPPGDLRRTRRPQPAARSESEHVGLMRRRSKKDVHVKVKGALMVAVASEDVRKDVRKERDVVRPTEELRSSQLLAFHRTSPSPRSPPTQVDQTTDRGRRALGLRPRRHWKEGSQFPQKSATCAPMVGGLLLVELCGRALREGEAANVELHAVVQTPSRTSRR